MNRDRPATVEHLRKVRRAVGPDGSSPAFKALFVTVDAAVPGKRELDQRAKGEFTGPAMGGKDGATGAGVALVCLLLLAWRNLKKVCVAERWNTRLGYQRVPRSRCLL